MRPLLLSLLALFSCASMTSADDRGEELIAKYLNHSARRSAVLDMQVDYREPGSEMVRLEFTWMRRLHEGLMAHLIRIDQPPSESGKLLLVKETGNGAAEYIAYRPASALKKKVRVTGARNYKYKGLNISVQELIGGEFGKYTHQFKGEETVDHVPSFLIESTLKARFQRDSNYKRMLSHLRKSDCMLLKWELFGKSDDLEKVVHATTIRPLEGILTVTGARVQDLKNGGELIVTVKAARYNPELKDALFSEEYLKQNSQ